MKKDTLPIRYSVRYKVPCIQGTNSLPIWIPFDADPMEYARKTLSEVHPGGYEIVDLRLSRPYVNEMLSEKQKALNERYINRIISELSKNSTEN